MNEYPSKSSVLIVATLSSFLSPYMSAALNIALPQIGDELNMDAISLSWVATAYLLASVAFMVPFGRIADIYGRKKIFTWGIIIFTVASLLLVVANSAIMLIVLRFVQGIGGAMVFSIGLAILTSVYPVGERGRVVGINVA
jgi:MFS family permease